jgi:hypothetical protein
MVSDTEVVSRQILGTTSDSTGPGCELYIALASMARSFMRCLDGVPACQSEGAERKFAELSKAP